MRVVVALVALFAVACGKQRATEPKTLPPASAPGNQMSELSPGAARPARAIANPLPQSEEVLAEGKRLYNHFNCAGCHAAGGGAIGPALMDSTWIYGSSPANIYWTIVEGRPQGMPAFGGKIVDTQIWQIVAYVRSLSNLPEEPQSDAAAPDGSKKL